MVTCERFEVPVRTIVAVTLRTRAQGPGLLGARCAWLRRESCCVRHDSLKGVSNAKLGHVRFVWHAAHFSNPCQRLTEPWDWSDSVRDCPMRTGRSPPPHQCFSPTYFRCLCRLTLNSSATTRRLHANAKKSTRTGRAWDTSNQPHVSKSSSATTSSRTSLVI